MNELKLAQGYTTITLFVLVFFILLAMIIHLVRITIRKSNDHTAGKGMKFFLLTTICAIISFEIACALTIYVTSQIILIHSHSGDPWLNDLYYESLFTMHYLIPTLDTFGHLCVVLVFITRFQYTFHTGYFMASKRVIRVLYTVLVLLFACSVVICSCIIARADPFYIMLAEILWEVAVEIMCIWILYLFLSKLYYLLKMQSNNDCKQKHNRFVDEVTRTIKASLESSRTIQASLSPHDDAKITNIPQITPQTSAGFSPQQSLRSRMTIDGICIDPIAPNKLNNSPPFIAHDPAALIPLAEDDAKGAMNLQLKIDSMRAFSEPLMCDQPKRNDDDAELNHMSSFSKAIPTLEDAVNTLARSQPATPILPPLTDHNLAVTPPAVALTRRISMGAYVKKRRNSGKSRANASVANDLVQVMTKMTLLVLFTVFISTLSMIGNVFVEMHELKTRKKHDVDLKYLWAEILPLIDIIITSFMLYCHFHFAEKVYRTLLGRLEILFLKGCLSVLQCAKEKQKEDHAASSINNGVTHQEKPVETPL